MTARRLDGKKLAQTLRAETAEAVKAFVDARGVQPTLAAVLVGADPASEVYIRNKERACEKAGFRSQVHRPPAEIREEELLTLVRQLNDDASVHGILVQLPLPKHIDATRVLDEISPLKDVDGFHPENVGLLSQGRPRFVPCTPAGVKELLRREEIVTAGKQAVVLGRSNIVGKPMAQLLLQSDSAGNATVTICHSRTADMAAMTKQAEILVVAIGKPNFVTGEMIRPGAVVIDVGINRTEEGLVGDVDFAAAEQIASAITPVPGGVGPLTIAMLLRNTLHAAELQTLWPDHYGRLG